MSDKSRAKAEKPALAIEIEHSPKSKLKVVGGGDRDQWNERLSNLVTRALPVDQHNAEAVSHAGSAVAAGTVTTYRLIALVLTKLKPREHPVPKQREYLRSSAMQAQAFAFKCNS